MKSHKLLLLSALFAVLPWHAAGAQSRQEVLVAQASVPAQPTPTPDDKTAPANAMGKPIPGSPADQKKMPSGEKMDAGKSGDESKAGSSPRQKDGGSDTSMGQGTPGGKTGAPDNAGMPGSGASSGSGGGADMRPAGPKP
ncbi:hypothetical protein RAS12_06585 [Achromobacter seleniivolatilans]|uniref:Uncharacterized protein n=1 Tax=Achromobacter seleniivolatilans TaxID=3047478 RepID=A0ABY9M626_9BURK|nr:hypothetical protein [Achromobacter sp. R39]WMD22039.1 hypothetical protein RAS12_06585 [Achromobacter sp. R39]